MKTCKQSNFDIVKQQINDIYNRIHNLKFCYSVVMPKIVETDGTKTIGDAYFIDIDNFDKIAVQIDNEEKYFILFEDGCFINLAYIFDAKGKIVKHKLDFASLFDSHLYLRFDYCSKELEENKEKHFASHMHTSLLKESFRFAVSMPVSPYSFLNIVLRHFYNDKSVFAKSLNDSKWKGTCFVDNYDFPHLKL